MNTQNQAAESTTATGAIITKDQLLNHWQGHRNLTRKVIEVFPEDKLYTYSIGGMRSAAGLITELLVLASPGIRGIVTGSWKDINGNNVNFEAAPLATKQEMLQEWDRITEEMNLLWNDMTVERFQETEAAYGMYEDTIIGSILYLIDNEIHHRAQMYVYLRSLGVTPPSFYDRA